jgi:hypothetical protein
MANSYVTNTQIKALMPDTTWGTSYDTLLTTLAERASRAIDRFTGREQGAYAVSTDTTRYFDGAGGVEQWIDEMAALPTTVAVAETGIIDGSANTGGTYTTWAAADYVPWPDNALAQGKPIMRLDVELLSGSKTIWTSYRRAVKITGKFGYSTTAGTPPEVVQATAIQAVRYFKRSQQAYTDTGAIVELGQLRYVSEIDPDVKNIVMHLRRLTV